MAHETAICGSLEGGGHSSNVSETSTSDMFKGVRFIDSDGFEYDKLFERACGELRYIDN